MPIYEYECQTFKHRFERSQRFSDQPITECPECGSGVRRVLFPVGVVFKGSGWYVTDSRKSPAPSESAGSGAASGQSDGSDGATGGESKAASKDSKSEASMPAASAEKK